MVQMGGKRPLWDMIYWYVILGVVYMPILYYPTIKNSSNQNIHYRSMHSSPFFSLGTERDARWVTTSPEKVRLHSTRIIIVY